MSAESSRRSVIFNNLFKENSDPWGFETSDYEAQKRLRTLAAFGGCTYDRVLEIGCANGVLTAELAEFCTQLVAVDVSQTALSLAKSRCAGFDNIEFVCAEIPGSWPGGLFDLIVFSEVLYFLDAEEIMLVSTLAANSLRAHGKCILVNWTGPNTLPIDGESAVKLFSMKPWVSRYEEIAELFRIDVLDFGDPSSSEPRHSCR